MVDEERKIEFNHWAIEFTYVAYPHNTTYRSNSVVDVFTDTAESAIALWRLQAPEDAIIIVVRKISSVRGQKGRFIFDPRIMEMKKE